MHMLKSLQTRGSWWQPFSLSHVSSLIKHLYILNKGRRKEGKYKKLKSKCTKIPTVHASPSSDIMLVVFENKLQSKTKAKIRKEIELTYHS